ncbi:MAG: adenylate/guanylate cyclase domain-containing protein [Chloroflexi bacterium]|nr:adenylate/guanylate cyclase domain-containing protein [Chloroflexota bacterium]MCH8339671.1 adenylate/guanylate cyclase domain-containing protein [Chloroflexota bacterium]
MASKQLSDYRNYPDKEQHVLGLPTGTVTFLFTDIEGSTKLWEQDEAAARQVLVRHDEIIERLVETNEGMLVRPRGEGDSRFAVFQHAPGAIASAAAIQQAFHTENWEAPEPLKVRMGLHTGHADLREGDYYGSAVNRCARVRSLAHGGQVLLSLATEQIIADYLPEGVELRDLGLHPLKGLTRPEQIFQIMIPDIPSDFPTLQTQIGPKHNLPEQLTPFVGRQSDIVEVRSLLSQDGIRLVTLKGPGGMGKTRLAVEVARQELEGFSDGARFVSLASLDSANQIVQAFLEALDLRPASREDPKDFLLHHLKRSELLIVVDNFEHILDGAPFVTEVLEHTSRVKILATSRERLGLRGESVFDVAGMQFADWQTVDEALAASCAQLFVQGAHQVQPQFELEEGDVAHLARICRLVEGTPLALLLSAGWMDMLSLEEIADEVESSLDFLETELQDAPDRQRSIKAVFDGSWDRLEEPEQELFMRLSVFRGGFTREAATEVAAANIRSLARLADKSFLHRDLETGRFEIHEMLRQYGKQRLLIDPEASQAARDAHALYFAELLAAKERLLGSRSQAEALDEIESDIENIRIASLYLAKTGNTQALESSLFSLWAFHEIRVWLYAGLELVTALEQALSDSSQGPETEAVSMQLRAIGAFYTIILGFPKKGLTTAQQTLDWLRQHKQLPRAGYSLMGAAVGHTFLREPAKAKQTWKELIEVGVITGSKWWELNGVNGAAGASLVMGDVAECERYLETARELEAVANDPWGSFWSGQLRAGLATTRGDLAEAKNIYHSLLDPLRSVSYLRGMQYTYSNLARINSLMNELDQAERNYSLSLRISYDTGQIRETLANLIDIAAVWKSQGEGEDAVETVAAVLQHTQIDQHALFREASLREEAETLREELKDELESDEYQSAWAKGTGEEMEDIAIRILRELEA